jgi:hypothetical protein
MVCLVTLVLPVIANTVGYDTGANLMDALFARFYRTRGPSAPRDRPPSAAATDPNFNGHQ